MDIPTPTPTSFSIAAGATMTSEEFIERSSSWTLACDNALLTRLINFSETISKQSEDILDDCENLSTQIDLLNSRVQTVTNQFLMLSNTQFTENRVEEFQETLNPQPLISQAAPTKTKAEREAELMSKMKEAIRTGVLVKSQQELTDDDANESISSHHPVKLKLPHIIGTSKFFSSRYCGLVDEMNMKPQQQITSHDEIPCANYPNPPEVYITQPEPQSFNVNKPNVTDKFSGDGEDLFFPSRELYRPPSRNQSLYKEGSPSSDDLFIQGASSATSSTSNIAQDKNYGSDTSLSDKKPKSMMDELNSILQGKPPPPVIGSESEDSDDDFKPRQTGKGLQRSMFVDDDDDIFGAHSLFGSKGTPFTDNDTFFDKPSVPKDIFSFSNPRPGPPVLFPSEPPPLMGIGSGHHQNSTPPTIDAQLDSKDSKSVDDQMSSLPNTKEQKSSVKLIAQGLKIDPSTLISVVNSTIVISSNKEPVADHPIPKLVSVHRDDQDTTYPEVKNSTEPLPEFGAKSFVKAMARGLNIDPSALNPGAKPPSHSRPTSISTPDDDVPISNPIISISHKVSSSSPLTSVSSPIMSTTKNDIPEEDIFVSAESANQQRIKVSTSSSLTSVSSPIVSTTKNDTPAEKILVPAESVDQKGIPARQNLSQKGFVKSMASGLKIDPTALNPGAKPQLHHHRPSTSVFSDDTSVPRVTEGVRGVDSEVGDKFKITDSSTPVVAESRISTNITPQNSKTREDSQGQAFRANSQVSNLIGASPSPASSRPSSTTSSANLKSTSIFDNDSSDEDLFKGKPILGHSTKKVPTALFPQESLKQDLIISKSSPTAPSIHPSEVYTASNSNRKPSLKTQAATNKSIFDDSDSEDDLFAFGSARKQISSSVIRKSSIIFVDDEKDDIFGSAKTPPIVTKAVVHGRNEAEHEETIGSIRPYPSVSVLQKELVKQKDEETEVRAEIVPKENSELFPEISDDSNRQRKAQISTSPTSPLFSKQSKPFLEMDGDSEIFPSTRTLKTYKSLQNKAPHVAAFGDDSSSKTTAHNIPKVKSIFDDSDSADELFTSSSLKTKGLNSKSLTNTASSIPTPTTKKFIFDDDLTDQDIFKSSRNKKQDINIPDIKEISNQLKVTSNSKVEDGLDGSLNPLPKETDEKIDNDVQTISAVPENKATNFVKSVAHSLNINPLALKPGARPSALHNSQPTSKSPDSSNAPPISVSKTDMKDDSNSTSSDGDKGFSFDDSLVTASLLPSIAKNRAKIVPRKRRPPSRKLLLPKEERIEDTIDSNSAIPITNEVEEVVIPPPVHSLSGENDDGELNLHRQSDSSAEE